MLETKQLSKNNFAAFITAVSLLPAILVLCHLVGIPSINGLISYVLAILVFGTFSQAKLQVNAPTTALAMICMACMSAHGFTGLCLAIMTAGFLQVVMGITKLGKFFRVLPLAALKGIMAGIGVSIIIDRIPALFGVHSYGLIFDHYHWGELGIYFGLGSLGLLFLWSRLIPQKITNVFPAIAVAVIVMAILGFIFMQEKTSDFTLEYVIPFAELPKNMFRGGILSYGLSLAFVSSLKSLLTTSKLESVENTNYDLNRELLLTGGVNLTCGLLGALPISAHLGRSLIQKDIGAKGRSTTFLQVLWLGLIVFFGMSFLSYLPAQTMSAVLIYCGYLLIDTKYIKSLKRYGKGEMSLMLITAGIVVVLDIEYGVLAGILLTMFRLSATLSADLNCELIPHKNEDNTFTLKLKGAVTFLNLPLLYELKKQAKSGAKVNVDTQAVYYFDQACIAFFVEWQKQIQNHGGSLVINFIDLLTRSHYPDKQKENILGELRRLDRRKQNRNETMGRRAIDRIIYADVLDKRHENVEEDSDVNENPKVS